MSLARDALRSCRTTSPCRDFAVTRADLDEVLRLKYGDLAACGWGPRMRSRFRYFTPDDYYEALIGRLVEPGCQWLDVGCGRELFPGNPALSRRLSERCGRLVGVDPDPTLHGNPYVHERVRTHIELFESNQPFDLISLRMVAEHLTDPDKALTAVAHACKPGGRVVVYTVNRFSPVPMITSLVPFSLHHPAKRFLWRTEKQDTFPTEFRMNTRNRLRDLFSAASFVEEFFAYLDDCRSFARFRIGQFLELSLWWMLRRAHLSYPETCLVGVYEKR